MKPEPKAKHKKKIIRKQQKSIKLKAGKNNRMKVAL